jgi:hypothetical protein
MEHGIRPVVTEAGVRGKVAAEEAVLALKVTGEQGASGGVLSAVRVADRGQGVPVMR